MNRHVSRFGCIMVAGIIAVLLCSPSPALAAAAMPLQQAPGPVDVSVVAEGEKLAIYVIGRDGGTGRRVAQVPTDRAPLLLSDYVALSPDGAQVAYVTMDDPFSRTNTVLWLAATDGSGARAIAHFPEGFWLAAPVWSPDGRRLAFVKERSAAEPEERLELWIMNRDGNDPARLLQGSPLRPALFTASEHVLAWSADSRHLQVNDQTASPPMRYTVNLAGSVVSKETAEKEAGTMAQAAGAATALPCGVQSWHQNDYGDPMRTCGQSIAGAGCALTSAAMVFKYYGINTDPPALNRCLGNSACPINWEKAASDCSENKVGWVGRPGFSYATIDGDLAAGRPVIVYLTRASSTHFVVVIGGGGQTPGGYSINDPWRWSPLRQTLAPYASEGWALRELRRYSGTPGCGDEGGPIGYGESKNGTISPAYDFDDYYFDASAGDTIEISQHKSNSNLDSYLRLHDPAGTLVAHDDDGGGHQNSFIRHTIGSGGRYRIRAMAWGASTGAYTLRLTLTPPCQQDCRGDPRWIAFGQTLTETIYPANDRDTYYFSGTAGRDISVRMNRIGGSLDSFLELWSPNNVRIATNDDGGGERNAWIVRKLPASGIYRISAYSHNNATTGSYSIKLESITGGGANSNLARGKRVAVSSVEFPGVEGWKATDGSTGTRWSSRFSDPQWIYVDLGQDRHFNQVVLKWETAYGRFFGIYYQSSSMCSRCWNNVYWTNSGRGGTNTINFGRISARYVLMYGVARGTPWGYSLWEFEVYDTTTTTVPLVPPDDPDKDENTAPLIAPLPPTEGEKDVMLSGDGQYGQEETPLASGEPAAVSDERGDPQTVAANIISPDADGLYKLYTPAGFVRCRGEASSQVDDTDVPITAYRWRSDRQGEIGTGADFTLPVGALWPGQHTLYLKAQNEMGTWSEEASVTLDVEWPHRVLLPGILR